MLHNIPKSVLDSFHQLQTDLGGNFKRQTGLNPRIFKSLIYAFDKVHEGGNLTRIMLLKEGMLLVHEVSFNKRFEIVQMFNDAYGHVFYPGYHFSKIQNFEVKTGESYGISVLKGFVLLKVEIYNL